MLVKTIHITIVFVICAYIHQIVCQSPATNSTIYTNEHMPIVKLRIYNEQYIRVLVGNPPKLMTFRLRFGISGIYIYSSPKSFSDTYQTYSIGCSLDQHYPDSCLGSPRVNGDVVITEILYLGHTKIRVPIIYGYPQQPYADPEDTSQSIPHDGIMGLAVDSVIWKYWTKWTWSRYHLLLGEIRPIDVAGVAESKPFVKSTSGSYFLACNRDLTPDTNSRECYTLIPSLEDDITIVTTNIYLAIKEKLENAKNSHLKLSLLKFRLYSLSQTPNELTLQTMMVSSNYINLLIDSQSGILMDTKNSFIELFRPCPMCDSDITMNPDFNLTKEIQAENFVLNGTILLGNFHMGDLVFGRNMITNETWLYESHDSNPRIGIWEYLWILIAILLLLCVWYPVLYESAQIHRERIEVLPLPDIFNKKDYETIQRFKRSKIYMDYGPIITSTNKDVKERFSSNSLIKIGTQIVQPMVSEDFKSEYNQEYTEPYWLADIFPDGLISIFVHESVYILLFLTRICCVSLMVVCIFYFRTEKVLDGFQYIPCGYFLLYLLITYQWLCLSLSTTETIQLYADVMIPRMVNVMLCSCWLIQVNSYKGQSMYVIILAGISAIMSITSTHSLLFILFDSRKTLLSYDSDGDWWFWVITCAFEWVLFSWFFAFFNIPEFIDLLWPYHPLGFYFGAIAFCIVSVMVGVMGYNSELINFINIKLEILDSIHQNIHLLADQTNIPTPIQKLENKDIKDSIDMRMLNEAYQSIRRRTTKTKTHVVDNITPGLLDNAIDFERLTSNNI